MNCQIKKNKKRSASAFFINLKPHISLILANIMWGSSFLSTKLLLSSMPPVTISICRFAFASFFLFIYIKFIKKEAIHFNRNGLFSLLLLGLFGITIYFYMENSSLLFITVISASFIVALIPVITILISMIFFEEKLSIINGIGVVIALTGASLVILKGTGISFQSEINTGYLFVFVAALSFAVYTVLGKKVVKQYSPIQTTFFTFLYGSILSIPLLSTEIDAINKIEFNISIVLNIIPWINKMNACIFKILCVSGCQKVTF